MNLPVPAPVLTLSALACVLAACAPSVERNVDDAAAEPAPNAPAAPPPSPAPSPAPPPLVPGAFVGEWNVDLADCGSSRNESRLVIEPDRIRWWESSGPVTSVTVLGPDAIQTTTELTGEGETWSATTRFTLRDPQTLVTTDAEGGEMARVRCPLNADG